MKYSVEIAEAPDPQRPNRRLETLVASVTTPPYACTGYSWVALMRPGERGEGAYLSPAMEVPGFRQDAIRMAARRFGFTCQQIKKRATKRRTPTLEESREEDGTAPVEDQEVVFDKDDDDEEELFYGYR